MTNTKERRRRPRYECRGEAKVLPDGMPEAWASKLWEISEAGCYIVTPEPPAPGTKVDLWLDVAGIGLQTRGVVLYSHPGQGMGIGFEEEDEDSFLAGVLAALPTGYRRQN